MAGGARGTVGGSQDVLLISFVLRMGIGMLITSTLVRVLDVPSFGFVAYVGTLLLLLHVAMDGGTGIVATREIAANPNAEPELLGRLLGFRLVSGGLVAAALACTAWLEPDATRRSVILSTALVAPILAFGGASVPLQVRQRLRGPALTGVVTQAAVLVLLLCLPFGSDSLPFVAAAGLLLLREVVNTWSTVLLARRACGFLPWPRFGAQMWHFARLAWPQGRFALLQASWFHADVFLVRVLCGDVVLAEYAAAYRPVGPLLFIPGMLVLPLVPVLAAATETDARLRVRQLSAIMLGLGSLGCVAAVLAPEALLGLLYSAEVASVATTVDSLRWLGVAFLLAFVSTPLLSALVALRRERWLLLVGVAALLLNVLSNLLFTPAAGAVSAAAITAATEACVAVGALWIWRRQHGSPFSHLALQSLVPAVLLAPVLLLLDLNGVGVLLATGIAGFLLLALPAVRRARAELRALGRS